MFKKILSTFMVLSMVMVMMPAITVGATGEETIDSGSCGDSATYIITKISDDKYKLVIKGSGAISDIDVAWSQEDAAKGIAGEHSDFVTEVEIESGITTIGKYSFSNFKALTKVTIPNSVTAINDRAFQYCSSLTEITIPDSVTTMGRYAFSKCTNLSKVNIPSKVTVVADYLFNNCSSLSEIKIPDGVTSIGSSAFGGCKILTKVNIPSGVTSIGGWAFYDCRMLTKIDIPKNVTNIGSGAFSNCENLVEITIPDGVKVIDISVFANCTSLTTVNLPDSIESIGEFAFAECKSLRSLGTKKSGIEFGYDAFADSVISLDSDNINEWKTRGEALVHSVIKVENDEMMQRAKNEILNNKCNFIALILIKDKTVNFSYENISGNYELNWTYSPYSEPGSENFVQATFPLTVPNYGKYILKADYSSGSTAAEILLDVKQYQDESTVTVNGQKLSIKFNAPEGIIENGSELHAEVIEKDTEKYNQSLEKLNSVSKFTNAQFFNLGITKPNGEEYTKLSGEIELMVQLPDSWSDKSVVYYIPDANEKAEALGGEIREINGIQYIAFKTDHFSTYALVENAVQINSNDQVDKDDSAIDKTLEIDKSGESDDSSVPNFPKTGDNSSLVLLFLGLTCISSLAVLVLKKRKNN